MKSQIRPISNVPSSHSLSADMATGWKPKLKIIGPMPLNFDNAWFDARIRQVYNSQASFYSIVYLGPRPLNSFAMHDLKIRDYKYKYQHLLSTNYMHLKAFFHKFYTEFEPQTKRPFVGMNPSIKDHPILFDSNFESGNLDCAVKVHQNEYDLVLRIDSNTVGHVQWYYFKVKNRLNTEKRIKLNLVNFRKNKTCYERGMRPYIKIQGRNWQQGGDNVEVSLATVKFGKETLNFKSNNESDDDSKKTKRLSFEINLSPGLEIQIAYSIPYTYTNLLNFLKQKKQNIYKIRAHQHENITFQIDYSAQSLSGLQIPVLKISEEREEKKKKYAIFLIGRQHPGQSNSSFVMEGIIHQLLQNTQEMSRLRKQCQFHIIPMLNPDGVVIGNFRTSLYGKDLNRLFRRQNDILIPEVHCAYELIRKIYKSFKKKFMLFLDIHGHSVRRNSFAYGPGIFDSKNIMDVRSFPKIISQFTQLFRYYSCTFRLEANKKSTARAVFGRFAQICYTIETSNWSYNLNSITLNFDAKSWKQVGIGISKALGQYIRLKIQEKIKMKEKRKKKSKLIPSQSIKPTSVDQIKIRKNNLAQTKNRIITLNSQIQQRANLSLRKNPKENEQKCEKKMNFNDRKCEQIEQNMENQSDKFSDAGFDSQGSEEDMNKSKFKKYINNASMMILEFKSVFYGEKEPIKPVKQSMMKSNTSQKTKKVIDIMACLRKNISNSSNSRTSQLLELKKLKELDKKQIIYPINPINPINPGRLQHALKNMNQKKQVNKDTQFPRISSLLSNNNMEIEQPGFISKFPRGAQIALRYQKKNNQS